MMKNYLIFTNFIKLFEEISHSKILENSIVVKYDNETDEIETIIEEANYISLFSDKKTIIISNYDQKSDELLLKYLEHPNENVTIIINSDKKFDERKKTSKLLKEKLEIVDYLDIKDYEVENLISEIFKKNNIKISERLIRKICEKCLYNYDVIYNECNKLIITVEQEVTEKDIDDLVSYYIEDNIFNFKEKIISKNIDVSLEILDYLIAKKEDVTPIFSLLGKDYRLMYIVKNSVDSDTKLASVLGVHPYPIKLARSKAAYYTNEDIKKIIVMLANMDIDIKSGKIDKNDAIRRFIYCLLKGEYYE